MGVDSATSRLVARRSNVMAALREKPMTKRELSESIDVSRSTIDRAVRELQRAGYVSRTDGMVRLTLPGSLALASARKHDAELAGIEAATPLIEGLPGTRDLPPSLFRDATISTPDRTAPDHPSEPLVDQITEATHLKHYATGIRPEYGDHYWTRFGSDGSTEILATSDVLSKGLQDPPSGFQRAIDSGQYELWETEETRQYSLLIADSRAVCMLLYDDHSLIGVVHSEAPDAVDWAILQYESMFAEATPVSTN